MEEKENESPVYRVNLQDASSEDKKNDSHLQTYKRRWYVLGMFSYAAVMQSVIWNTYGPIAQSSKRVYGWTDGDVGMLPNYGNISYFLCMIPCAWVMDVKGLRASVLLASTLMLVATALRCIPCDNDIATWLINIACILNGIAGCIVFGGPALVSATWFPLRQRATATAMSSVAAYIGISLAFIIGPIIVPEIEVDLSNNCTNTSVLSAANHTLITKSEAEGIQMEKEGIMTLMYIECGASVLLFLLVLVYFPAKPPTPPSVTASIERTSYLQGLKQLLRNKHFVVILLAYGLPIGSNAVYFAVLDLVLDAIDISQETAGWIGFYATIAGCVSALLVSRLADLFMRRMKLILLILYILATVSMLWFVCIHSGYLDFDMASIYASLILMGFFVNGSIPLLFEIACEASYPIAEGVTGGALTMMNTIIGSIILSVLQTPNIGVVWLNWVALALIATNIGLLLTFQEKYSRTDLDVDKEIYIESTAVSDITPVRVVNGLTESKENKF